ncbi:putative Hydroxyproline-rich glycoprotein family protein [Quillaja saponaria]|uniref:Hydroxyproline-rich glycoprotein family protein n=1 Tax=Quillaja saponaria TaxID=32244 RepID=A0AAD7M1J9_QUISA|nr:putative Hydroxyproline-rich glycoprotein family protein [Quillaja saponaria]
MGKLEKIEGKKNLHQQQNHDVENQSSSGFICQGCSMVLQGFAKEFNFKCLFVLILSLSVLLSGIFWILPIHKMKYGFDAKDAIKLSATVHAFIRLEKPVSQLVPHIDRLEYDIFEEIGLPNTKVVVLSMHQGSESNWTNVVFGVLSDPMDVLINPVSLSVLRSSLIELFLQQSNLTLTTSIFGYPSMFEILKFPGGITVLPQSASIWQIPQILFNFTLHNSISEILDKFVDLKDELKFGLHLSSYENVYVQITNTNGSTIAPPVTIQASVVSNFGMLLPQRLKQLALTITGSPAKNLGLDNSVFGKVKSISLSSVLKCTLHATPPGPSPAPSPESGNYVEPPISPSYSPSYSPISSPAVNLPPCVNCKSLSPAPSSVTKHPPQLCPYHGGKYSPSSSPVSHSNPSVPPYHPPPIASPSSLSFSPASKPSPVLSPIPDVSFGSRPSQDKGSTENLLSPSITPSPSFSAESRYYREFWLLGLSGLMTIYLLC